MIQYLEINWYKHTVTHIYMQSYLRACSNIQHKHMHTKITFVEIILYTITTEH